MDREKPKPAPKAQPISKTPPTNTPPLTTPELPVKQSKKEKKGDDTAKAEPPAPVPVVEQTDRGSIAKKLSSKFTGFLSKSKTQEPAAAPSPSKRV